MSWRGQGGRRAKGRRGQDPEIDNTAWLAELEREAAQAGDDEDDWASTLRGRRASGPSPPAPPTSEPSWAPTSDPSPPPPSGHGLFDADPGDAGASPWSSPPPPDPDPDPDWSSWRPPAADPFEAPRGHDWGGSGGDHGEGWQPAGVDTPTGAWSPVGGEPDYPPPSRGRDYLAPAAREPEYPGPVGRDSEYPAPPAREPDHPAPAGGEWDYPTPAARGPDHPGPAAREYDHPAQAGHQPEYPAPAGREPDYPALFGELYRRRTSDQDPIWEAPPAAEPPPDQGQPDPPSGGWPFEETTGSWEPSDRSFIWPAEELPSTQAEWDRPAPQSWLDDPVPRPSTAPSSRSEPDETSAWPAPSPEAAPDQTAAWPAPSPHAWADPEPAPWVSQPGAGNGASPTRPLGSPASRWTSRAPVTPAIWATRSGCRPAARSTCGTR